METTEERLQREAEIMDARKNVARRIADFARGAADTSSCWTAEAWSEVIDEMEWRAKTGRLP